MLKVLLLCNTFNSLTQKIFCHLKEHGIDVSVEYAINEEKMIEGADLFAPDLILATYLTKKIPKEIFTIYPTFIIHPGPFGDRGAYALDNAILNNMKEWGVSILEADDEFDAGAVWGHRNFSLPEHATKGYLYRTVVSDLAIELVDELIEKLKCGKKPLTNPKKPLHPKVTQSVRAIDWNKDCSETVIRKINASDNYPGVRDRFFDMDVYFFGALKEQTGLEKKEAKPKEILAKRDGAVLIKTIDGAVWIQQMTEITNGIRQIKLPSTYVLKDRLKGIKEKRISLYVDPDLPTFKEITFYKKQNVGFLAFDFYNGAMSSQQCIRLKYAIKTLRDEVDVLVLMGGEQFFSNGIHLTILEDSKKQGEDGWSNINAMNNLIKTILFSDDILTITAFRANAGAGGVFLGIAGDIVFAKSGVVLNPHYKTIGLSGSEYHTYTLPRRVGNEIAQKLLDEALPINAQEAKSIGLIDEVFKDFQEVESYALQLAQDEERFYELLDQKRDRLEQDEEYIQECVENELEKMYPQFWDPKSDFHKLRHNFVYKICPTKTPLRIAKHRRVNA
ncbi:hydrogenase maturation protein [Nitratiruptor tergarcus]|uniref:Methionyl-tRNA formyltransferase n=1 Tax=Nitratiruptor tergarcus DSM 16512 TaxID=1069081 RepID=A0A1W1WTZ5_9BACT|nr:hydrogenase maturation protein [Nitratiruptor tergarcus]SMC09781.1 Methionyl-tRNA formyltransferase [Nitratiruptor tergarcus DSM 16512]